MEIHKPKPWHGWREFLKEYLIIFVGVLTALAFEQAIEWLHRRAEVAEARHALRSEIAANATVALYTVERERCTSAKLDQWVAWARGGARPTFARGFGFSAPHTSNWEVVKAGAAAHMPLAERLSYSRFYDLARVENMNNEREVDVWQRLAGQLEKVALSHADAQRVLEDASQARGIGLVRSNNNLAIIRTAKSMGVEPPPVPATARQNLVTYCNGLGIAPTSDGPAPE